jgi:hypothetical protein
MGQTTGALGCLTLGHNTVRHRVRWYFAAREVGVETKKDDKKIGLSWRIIILTALGLTILWFYLMPESLLFEEESFSSWGWVVESLVRFVVCLGVSVGAFVHWR